MSLFAKKMPIATWYTQRARQARRIVSTSLFQKILVISSSTILLLSTVFWTILGTIIQRGNADQLVNAYLFEQNSTLQGAEMSGQHSFLLKWPLFWLIKFFGYSDIAYVSVTVVVTLVTVGALAYILYRIVRKPLLFSIICLCLASILLATPAQPYNGALLPVNMAMLTTRNIEYVIYLVSLILIVRIQKVTLRSWRIWLAALFIALLIASDKLFLPLSLGGSLLALFLYGILRKRHLVAFPVNWFMVSAIGSGLSFGILWLVRTFVTHVVSANEASPYDFIHTIHDFILGSVYAVLGLFTNFGANPAFDAIEIKQIPHQLVAHLLAPGGLVFIVNFAIACIGILACQRLIHGSLINKKYRKLGIDQPTQFTLALLWTTIVAVIIFITTNHYYPVDARYLTIALFALMTALAVFLRDSKVQKWILKHILPIGFILLIGISMGILSAVHIYEGEAAAMSAINIRNSSIAAAMRQHSSSQLLVGDYWRVMPAKQAAGNTFTALPLANCFDPRNILTSSTWQVDLTKHAFSYLLSLDTHSPDFPQCTLDEVVTHYGKPNASSLIAGTLDHPKEVLLFYDYGIQHNVTAKHLAPATVIPVALQQLGNQACTGKTIVSIVAHQDDDLLFMNPDHMYALRAGGCLRTVYVTAGDAGAGPLYWLGREKGSEEAYGVMAGLGPTIWIQRIVKLNNHQFITIATPKRGDTNVSLIFMHLPDGNVTGTGFKTTSFESLARLESGKIATISAIDGQSTYTESELTDALTRLIAFYTPDEIDTQAPMNMSGQYPDHSDHMAVGRDAQTAYQAFKTQHPENIAPIKYYVGYPIHALPPNVSGADYQDKAAIFFTYSNFDNGGCTTFTLCDTKSVYGQYLRRQYAHAF